MKRSKVTDYAALNTNSVIMCEVNYKIVKPWVFSSSEDIPFAKALELSPRTGGQAMVYLIHT